MKDTESSELRVQYDSATRTLTVTEETDSPSVDRQVFRQRFTGENTKDLRLLESTIGQLLLWALDSATPGGLGFGDYSEVFERLCKENLAAFVDGTDLANPQGQFDLATVMFSHGRRGSWEQIEQAISLFEQAADGGHVGARRFLQEDWPIVRDRLETKLKKGGS